MLATLIDRPFDGTEWLFEIKLDGFRAIAEINKKDVEIYSRNFQTFNDRFPNLVRHLKKLNLDAILDGEIVALDEKGISHFQLLQNYQTEKNIYFYIFDILYLNGEDLRTLPLTKRKSILKNVIKPNPFIRYLEHVENEGKKFFNICKEHGLEGVVGKKKASAYKSGVRSKEWVKLQAELRQEVVICGFTKLRQTRKHFGALIVGVYSNHALRFAGHVGGGFTDKQLEEIKSRLDRVVTDHCPFQNPPHTNTSVTWVKPAFICEVKFKEWTSEGIMRMPIFLGMRTDKPARLIKREKKEKTNQILARTSHTFSGNSHTLMPDLDRQDNEAMFTQHCPHTPGGQSRAQKRQFASKKCEKYGLEEYDFITNREKLFWEKEKITKGDLLDYYASIATFILPYLIDRPESLKRFPNGIGKPNFFQKNLTTYPKWLSTYLIEHHDKTVNYALIQDVKSLLYVVNLGCIELHSWFSRIQHLENPDFLIFDLDPEAIAFDAVVKTAQKVHAILNAIQIPSYCKTSGGRGLHVGVPLQARYTYEQAKRFAELIALIVHRELPKITSLERSPSKRQKKVYIDCYQNNFGQTLAVPYSVRAKPGAPVSTPLEWSEVKQGLDPYKYTIFNTLKRLKKKGDLFKPVLQKGIDLQKALKRLELL